MSAPEVTPVFRKVHQLRATLHRERGSILWAGLCFAYLQLSSSMEELHSSKNTLPLPCPPSPRKNSIGVRWWTRRQFHRTPTPNPLIMQELMRCNFTPWCSVFYFIWNVFPYYWHNQLCKTSLSRKWYMYEMYLAKCCGWYEIEIKTFTYVIFMDAIALC